jgi:hypothetical protein
MERWVLAFCLGVVGGVAGAVGVDLVRTSSPTETASAAGDGSLSRDLAGRLDRIEAALATPAVTLRGTSGEPAGGVPTATADALKRIEEKMTSLETKVTEAVAKPAGEEGGGRGNRAPRKRVSLGDVSAELSLSRSEESELRQIYKDTWDKAVGLLAQPDGDTAAIQKELEDATKTPGGGRMVMAKYLPKFLGKMGEFLALDADRRTRVEQTVGAEKAAKLESMDLIEANPLGLGGSMNFEARSR